MNFYKCEHGESMCGTCTRGLKTQYESLVSETAALKAERDALWGIANDRLEQISKLKAELEEKEKHRLTMHRDLLDSRIENIDVADRDKWLFAQLEETEKVRDLWKSRAAKYRELLGKILNEVAERDYGEWGKNLRKILDEVLKEAEA